MLSSSSIGLMHQWVAYLLEPVVWLLMFSAAFAVMEIATLLGERIVGLNKWRRSGAVDQFEQLARRRIERSDFMARIAPMLGLMGTLIPLGPGLSALGEGDLTVLTTAMSVAFDTTVLGLFVGIVGFVIGRVRRRWYDEVLTFMEANLCTAAETESANIRVQSNEVMTHG